ncbi:MAG: LytTR family DNA-binding domain-containing protein [Flavobacteriaceae bacterium]|nr:LytTR family DNA-binding domain-containing protein [Flavobacteriaceae bacterium]
MKCIIVDDEEASRAIVSQLCVFSEKLEIVEEFSNAIDAMIYLNNHDVDVVFLDIHMPGFTGLDFAQTVKEPPKIILITSDKKFALQAYEYEAVIDYLVKPIQKSRFDKALNKLEKIIEKEKTGAPQKEAALESPNVKEIYVNIDRRLIKLNLDDISIIEAKGDYINIKTDTESFTVHSTLKKIYEKLPENRFLQIHRSYIINFLKIIDIEDNSVLIGKDVIPISRSNRPDLMRRLNLL